MTFEEFNDAREADLMIRAGGHMLGVSFLEERREAWNAALEVAAKVADLYTYPAIGTNTNAEVIAASIRARKETAE